MVPADLPRLPAVDGLRALAVALVIAYHFDLFMPGGFLGVDLFFAISGFVIARQLLAASQATTRSTDLLASFYRRRAVRLLPAALVLSIGVGVGSLVLGDLLGDFNFTRANAAAGLSGVGNWFSLRNPDTFATQSRPLMHMWSLSIEEQFYLAFPLLILPMRRWISRSAITVGVLAIAAGVVAAVCGQTANEAFFSTTSRIAPIGAGVLAAVLFQSEVFENRVRTWRLRSPLLVALLGGLLVLALTASWDASWLRHGGFVVMAFPFAAIVALCAVPGRALVDRALCNRVSQTVAVRSYSLYLWHFPVAFLFESFSPLPRLLLRLALSVCLSEASLRFVERPTRRFRDARLAQFAPLAMVTSSVALIFFAGLTHGD